MGSAKRYLEEVEARGWGDVDKTVCSDCLTDYALSDAVRAHGGDDPCDYCGRAPSAPDATAPVEIILDLVVDGLRSEYEDPIHQVLWSSADGGYQMGSYGTSDLLFNHEVTEDGDLLDDLVNAIEGEVWVQRDPYAASPTAALKWGWDEFRTYVKRRRRFTFLVRDASPSYGAGEISMDGIPAAVASAVELAVVPRQVV